MFGDGTQSRSFTYVADVVDALVKLAQEPRAIGEVFNIGNTEEVTIADLAERVKRMTDSASPVQFIPYDQAYEAGFEDMPRRVPDISKVRNLVGYEPRLSLDEIVCRVWSTSESLSSGFGSRLHCWARALRPRGRTGGLQGAGSPRPSRGGLAALRAIRGPIRSVYSP